MNTKQTTVIVNSNKLYIYIYIMYKLAASFRLNIRYVGKFFDADYLLW